MADTIQTYPLDAKSWHFRWPRSGWATLTIIETTHQVAIQSDWGDVAYRWSGAGVGKQTMVEFFLGCGTSYLAQKLCSNLHRSVTVELDRDATETALNRMINEAHADQTLDADAAEGAREDIDDLLDMLEDNSGSTPDSWEWHPEWYEGAVTKPGFIVEKLSRDILPIMQSYLTENGGV